MEYHHICYFASNINFNSNNISENIFKKISNEESIKGLPDISKQAHQIKDSIKSLEKELDHIQNECNHTEYDVRNCPSQSAAFQLRRVCKKCTKEIGYPTKEERYVINMNITTKDTFTLL